MRVSNMETIGEFFSIDNIQEFHGVQQIGDFDVHNCSQ